MNSIDLVPGPVYMGDGRCRFTVWAPFKKKVELHLIKPRDRVIAMERGEWGYWTTEVDGAPPGTMYKFRLDGRDEYPDPASRFQPQGVHGHSAVVDTVQHWSDPGFSAGALEKSIIYELHIGTFSPEGTFDAVIPRLEHLQNLGVNVLELMPVAQFSGRRNWGYDGVFPWAVQNSYGGPGGLRRLVDACHSHGIAVLLDVVYNHIGPEGNILGEYGPYFSEHHRTPWGPAPNFDEAHSDEVRAFFIGSAKYFIEECHIDGFRLDAVHALHDSSPVHFLRAFADTMAKESGRLGRRIYVIAESDENDARLVLPAVLGGLGLDAVWSDDFHFALHARLTGERQGYYQDFGSLDQIAAAYRSGFVFQGQFSSYRQKSHGTSSSGISPSQFVVFAQNHDKVGNRAQGDRYGSLLPPAAQRLAACVTLLSPYVPLIFMGEEYGETAPFLYFTNHTNAALGEAVRRGRAAEFAGFGWRADQLPNPQDEATFARSRLNWDLPDRATHRELLNLYRELLRLRRSMTPFQDRTESSETLQLQEDVLLVNWFGESGSIAAVINFGKSYREMHIDPPAGFNQSLGGEFRVIMDSEAPRWNGSGGNWAVNFIEEKKTRLHLEPLSALLLEWIVN